MSLCLLPRQLLRRRLLTLPAAVPRPLIPRTPRITAAVPKRWNSSAATTPGITSPSTTPTTPENSEQPPPPSYQLTFTCRPCRERSAHTVSKQAYHRGSVLIQCPGCKNRHVITDHLKIFGETERSLDDILADAGNGDVVKHARIADNGDIELFPGGEVATEEETKE